MKINRAKLLKTLGTASVGLSPKELLEQSNCFVFAGSELVTYNGEVLTRCPSPIPEFEGAVIAQSLLKLLSKFPDEVIDASPSKSGKQLIIKGGRRRRAGLTAQAELLLPHADVPVPAKWRKVPEALVGAMTQAARSCGKDTTQPHTTVVHVTPDMVEGFDNMRIFRYKMQTGVKKNTLLPMTSIESIAGLVLSRIHEGGDWVHFRTPSKHVISIRLSMMQDYPSLDQFLKLGKQRKQVRLPDNLGDIVGRAEVMQDSAIDAMVEVTIEAGKLTLRSRKEGGWFRETKKISYDDETLAFSVNPKFLQEVLEKTRKVTIGEGRMMLRSRGACFVVCLKAKVDEEE